jgi:soluble lytic murein transglycosylase
MGLPLKNKTTFLIILLIIIFGCKNNNYSKDEIIKDILASNRNNYRQILRKYRINNFNEVKISDPNYLYLIAKLLYNKYDYNEISENLLLGAIKIENIFRDDALILYINMLIKNRSFDLLKQFIRRNEKYIKSINQDLLLDYANSVKIVNINNIPNKVEYLNILYLLIKDNYKEILSNQENKDKIDNFIVQTKLYESKDKNIYILFKDILNWNPKDYFLGCVYYSNQYSKDNLSIYIDYYLKNFNDTSNEKIEIVKKLAQSMGLKKYFYQTISKYYQKNKLLTYYYAIDAIYFGSYKLGISLLNSIANDFTSKSDMNYNIRYYQLYNTRSYTEKWIEKVVDFFNDYPTNYKSKLLFNNLMRYTLVNNKGKEYLKYFTKIENNDNIDPLQKSQLIYKLYLMDDDNKLKWKDILTKEHPLSYGALRLNKGINFKFNTKNPVTIPTEKEMTAIGLSKYKKIKYLLELDFIEEAKKISLNDVPARDKAAISNLYHQYYISKENYYNALKSADDILTNLYGNNFYKADNLELVKKYYPMHYKEYILQYSKEFNIDPALAFAVMREESYFNKSIVSHQHAIGLMQIIPPTGRFIAKKLGITNYDLYNPKDNIRMGIYYLKFLNKYFDKIELVLSSYNAGHGKTQRWYKAYRNKPEELMYELIPIYETRYYIVKVMKSYYIYKYLLEDEEYKRTVQKSEEIIKEKALSLKLNFKNIKDIFKSN